MKLTGIRLDIETRSRQKIKVGSYRYSECPDFAVLLISYAPLRRVDDEIKMGKPRLLDLTDAEAVQRFREIIQDPAYEKHAYNANFERIALSRWLGMGTGDYLDPFNWHCSAVRANVAGVFGTLDEVAKTLRAPVRKMADGKRLIKMFSEPRKDGTFLDPADAPDEFAKFGEYCDNDVLTEAAVAHLLPPIPEDIQRRYEADQRINDRGVGHNKRLSRAALAQVTTERDRLMGELKVLTGLDNPNSNPQMLGWVEAQGYPMEALHKEARADALADPDCPPLVAKVLTMKGQASLSSVTKHKAALDTRCSDGRIRGALQFYGAHTGREAGRGIQPQNLPTYEAPAEHRRAMVQGFLETLGRVNPFDVAKGTVRASLVPARGNVFVVPDYNAIEARVLGWLAGEQWVEDEFTIGDGKIYEATAAQMFGVDKAQLLKDLKACGKCGTATCAACVTRAKGKVSDLALGYAGGAGALITMGAEGAGIDCGNYTELHREWEQGGSPGKFYEWEKDRHDYPELIRLRDLYRNNRPATVLFWKNCARAWDVACSGKAARWGQDQCVTMLRDGKHNRMVLPSGRSIWYRFARAHHDPDRPERIDRRTYIGKAGGVGHTRIDTHGGKLTENVTQAVARDVLFDLIMKIEDLTAAGWPGKCVLHVHDEVVLEVPERHADRVLGDVLDLMSTPPDWAPGLAVKGAGTIMARYGK